MLSLASCLILKYISRLSWGLKGGSDLHSIEREDALPEKCIFWNVHCPLRVRNNGTCTVL